MIRASLAFALWVFAPLAVAATFDPIQQYDARNALLSTRVPQPYLAPYFTDNETGAERFYPRFDRVGGVMIGVGFQQNFTYLVHGQPELYVFFDINPDVTEILVPFFGELMAGAPRRAGFLSALLGVPIAEADVRGLLEPQRRPDQADADLGAYLPGVVAGLLDRVPQAERRRNFERRIGPIGDRRPLTVQHRAEVLRWFDLLEEDMLAGGRFFQASAASSWNAGGDAVRRKALAGWLSSEDTYRTVRRYWMEGRIVGVTGDIGGPSAAKLARWLRQERSGQRVTFLYLSNIGASIQGHEPPAYFSKLYGTLGELPLAPKALTLIAQGANVAYLRPYQRAREFYDSLGTMDAGIMAQLIELPLSYASLGNKEDAIRKLREGVARVVREPEARADLLDLLDRLIAGRLEAQGKSTVEFKEQVKRQWPALDTSSDAFRALEVVLGELGVLSR